MSKMIPVNELDDAYTLAKRFITMMSPVEYHSRDTMFPLAVFILGDSRRIVSVPKSGSWKFIISDIFRSIVEVSTESLSLILDSIEKHDRDTIFLMYGGNMVSLCEPGKYSPPNENEKLMIGHLSRLSDSECWDYILRWFEEILLPFSQTESQGRHIEEPALTISCGDTKVVYQTAADLLDGMQELFSTGLSDLNRNPITDYLKTLSYASIQTLLAQGPVTIDVSAKP